MASTTRPVGFGATGTGGGTAAVVAADDAASADGAAWFFATVTATGGVAVACFTGVGGSMATGADATLGGGAAGAGGAIVPLLASIGAATAGAAPFRGTRNVASATTTT